SWSFKHDSVAKTRLDLDCARVDPRPWRFPEPDRMDPRRQRDGVRGIEACPLLVDLDLEIEILMREQLYMGRLARRCGVAHRPGSLLSSPHPALDSRLCDRFGAAIVACTFARDRDIRRRSVERRGRIEG